MLWLNIIVPKYRKTCSTLLMKEKCKLELYQDSISQLSFYKIWKSIKVGMQAHSHRLVGSKMQQCLWKAHMHVPCASAIPLQGMYLTNRFTGRIAEGQGYVLNTGKWLYSSKGLKKLNHPVVGNQFKKWSHNHTTESKQLFRNSEQTIIVLIWKAL